MQRVNRLSDQGQDHIGNDFDRFFADPVVRYQRWVGIDWALDWFKTNGQSYKMVAKAARDLFAIPSVEVDIERLFSEGRNAYGLRRTTMDASSMQMARLLKSHFDLMDKEKKVIIDTKQAEHQELYGARRIPAAAQE